MSNQEVVRKLRDLLDLPTPSGQVPGLGEEDAKLVGWYYAEGYRKGAKHGFSEMQNAIRKLIAQLDPRVEEANKSERL